MRMSYTDQLIEIAILEDVGDGDHSSLACIPDAAGGKAQLLVKEDGVIVGVALAEKIFRRMDPELVFKSFINDGDLIKKGDIVFTIEGSSRSILQAERLVLNFMQRMSGIATLTDRFVSAIAGTGCQVMDTRKTTPGLRAIEKWAVRIGGGRNHRTGLYDMVLIKDNHVDLAGGIKPALQAARAYLEAKGLDLKVEIETRDLGEVEEALAHGGADRIMLDNFPLDLQRQAVERIGRACETEASGGITLETARAHAETGVDFISVGALTHSVPSLDLSLKAM